MGGLFNGCVDVEGFDGVVNYYVVDVYICFFGFGLCVGNDLVVLFD